MLNSLIIARKELTDHLRDVRTLASTVLFALMGPAVVGIILLASPVGEGRKGAAVVAVMAAVFTLVSAFSGGSGVAVDMVAGERERRSLLPLLMSSASRREIVVGKWLAASTFGACSAVVTLLGFVPAVAHAGTAPRIVLAALELVPSLCVLALFAGAVEVSLSAWCRNVKEANTYLAVLTFVVIAVAMRQAFSVGSAASWWFVVPIVGHQHVLQEVLLGVGFSRAGSAVLAGVSILLAALSLAGGVRLLERDAIVVTGSD